MAATITLSSTVEDLKSDFRVVGKRYRVDWTDDNSSPGTEATVTIPMASVPFRIFAVALGTKPTDDTRVRIYHPKKAAANNTDMLDDNGKINFSGSKDDGIAFEAGSKPVDYPLFGNVTVAVGASNAVNSGSATLYIECLNA